VSTDNLKKQRAAIWEKIHAARKAKKAAKTDAQRAKARDEYRALVKQFEATREQLEPAPKSAKAKPAPAPKTSPAPRSRPKAPAKKAAKLAA
jgi:hypothetical protein